MDFFQFEADFVDNLRCIPMQVRFKLDTCGIKLKLTDWAYFSSTERQVIVQEPCATPAEILAYRDLIQNLVVKYAGAPAKEIAIETNPAWFEIDNIPADLQTKAEEVGVKISLPQWAALTPLQRFALIKLSRPSHENKNFLPALQEFHLIK